jgi:hypothetical protein
LERFQSLLDDQVFLAQQRSSEADFTRVRIDVQGCGVIAVGENNEVVAAYVE